MLETTHFARCHRILYNILTASYCLMQVLKFAQQTLENALLREKTEYLVSFSLQGLLGGIG